MSNPELFQVMEAGSGGSDPWAGYSSVRDSKRPAGWDRMLAECIDVMTNEKAEGFFKWAARVQEAANTASFPLLFADTLDRAMIATYRDAPRTMETLFRVNRTVPDFRTVKRNRMHGADDRLQRVAELGDYTEIHRSEEEFTYSVKKYGALYSVSWEAIINDNQNILTDQPERFGRSAAKTEEWYLTQLLFDSNGPNTTYFEGTGGMTATSTLDLTAENIETAYHELSTRTGQGDDPGPMAITPRYLWYSPHLELTVNKILQSQLMITGANATIPNKNIVSTLGLIPLKITWAPQIVTGSTATMKQMWGLFSDESEIPVGEVGFLAGRNDPEIFLKSSNQVSVGGGDINPVNGDFLNDRVDYKVRHVFGGTTMDPRAGWASYGHAT